MWMLATEPLEIHIFYSDAFTGVIESHFPHKQTRTLPLGKLQGQFLELESVKCLRAFHLSRFVTRSLLPTNILNCSACKNRLK